MTQENSRIPVLLNGQGDYVRDREYVQPVEYRRSQRIEIPLGCFVMMVTQEEFGILKSGQARMLVDGNLRMLQGH